MDFTLTAEQQIAALKALDCGYAQGYVFSKPVPLAAAEKLLYHSYL